MRKASPNLRLPGPCTEQRTEQRELAADHPPPVTGSQSQKGAIAAPERHYLQNCKQASLLTKTLGVLDGQHLPEKVHWLYTQKTEWQGGDKLQ